MRSDWTGIRNPVLDRRPGIYARDPALVLADGVLRCYHTAVEEREGAYRLFVDVAESEDLAHWGAVRRLTHSPLNYSSPGNALWVKGRWELCLQSYPMAAGELYGNETSRLWLMASDDLETWGEPRLIAPQGCTARWSRSHRQIDPYLVHHDGRYWCFYKTAGRLGLLVSDDLHAWEEASPDRPVLGPEDTPDGATVENPCVVRSGDGFVLFFAPCRPGRGIGVARSADLIHWREVRYLEDFPRLPWAPNGPTAAMVLDAREELGHWLMAFHGETDRAHGAALGLAWSDDLVIWHAP